MQSSASSHSAPTSSDTSTMAKGMPNNEINVVVTGFGKFGNMTEENPAWSVASSLPPEWEVPFGNAQRLRLRIHVRYPAVHVGYQACHELIDEIHSSGKPIHLIMHIGVATARSYYAAERLAHRDIYPKPDVDGNYERDAIAPDYWKTSPPELYTNVSIDGCVNTWKSLVPGSDVRSSNDAGHYVCDYIYYSSLARLRYMNNGRALDPDASTAMFLHIPPGTDEASIQEGRNVALGLISSIMLEKFNLK